MLRDLRPVLPGCCRLCRRLALVEAKTTRTILPKMGHPMRQLMGAAKAYECQGFIVHPGPDLPGF